MEGQAPAPAAPAAPQPGGPASPQIVSRMKSFLAGPEAPAEGDAPAAGATVAAQPKATSEPSEAQKVAPEDTQVPDTAEAAEDQADDSVDVQSDDAQSEDRQFSNLTELLEAAGLDSDKGFDLELPVKIDGKEGTAKLRDLVKSYQLDSHINQKLESANQKAKALEADRQQFQAERAQKLLALDAGHQTLERALIGEFQAIDWQKLAAEDPQAYNAKFVEFQQRNAQLQDIARSIQTEKQQHQQQLQQAQNAYLEEQKRLLTAKVPEWADETRRSKDKAEMLSVLSAEYGITKEEFEAIADHRHALVVRDAWQWRKLQKSKPSVLNKVKAAPKLLKPGSQQSRAVSTAIASNKDRDRLKTTGRVSDARPVLKRILFGTSQ